MNPTVQNQMVKQTRKFFSGVPQDYNQAINWFQKAADQGDADAKSNVARMYTCGLGVTQDLNLAHEWYEKAAAQGHGKAKRTLESLVDERELSKKQKQQRRECSNQNKPKCELSSDASFISINEQEFQLMKEHTEYLTIKKK